MTETPWLTYIPSRDAPAIPCRGRSAGRDRPAPPRSAFRPDETPILAQTTGLPADAEGTHNS